MNKEFNIEEVDQSLPQIPGVAATYDSLELHQANPERSLMVHVDKEQLHSRIASLILAKPNFEELAKQIGACSSVEEMLQLLESHLPALVLLPQKIHCQNYYTISKVITHGEGWYHPEYPGTAFGFGSFSLLGASLFYTNVGGLINLTTNPEVSAYVWLVPALVSYLIAGILFLKHPYGRWPSVAQELHSRLRALLPEIIHPKLDEATLLKVLSKILVNLQQQDINKVHEELMAAIGDYHDLQKTVQALVQAYTKEQLGSAELFPLTCALEAKEQQIKTLRSDIESLVLEGLTIPDKLQALSLLEKNRDLVSAYSVLEPGHEPKHIPGQLDALTASNLVPNGSEEDLYTFVRKLMQ